MKTRRLILSLFMTILGILFVQAQEVVVNVKPVRNILPPQVMLYLSNTGQYFSVTLMNNSGEDQYVYFGLSLGQIMPSSDLEIVVPGGPNIPKQPIVIPAGQTKILDAVEMRTLFNHVSSDNIQMPANLFDDVLSGSFGNLPEGTYELVLHAYKWNPLLATPQLVNNPSMSRCTFNVCYEAQPPQWTAPNVQDGEMGVYTLSKQYPMFLWMAPIVNCNPSARTFTYDIKIVRLTGMQTPDVAIDKDPVVYQANGLTMPQCLIPTHVINTLSTADTYVARVTARSNATQIGSLDYIHVLNDGMSDLRLFRIKDYSAGVAGPTTQYGVPKLISPEPYGLNSTKYATFSPSEPMVKWIAPQATGDTSQKVNFRYKVRIVNYIQEYELSGKGLSEALAKEKPLYESPLIDATQFTLPVSVVNEFENKSMYAMEVVAIPDTVEGAYMKYSFADEGHSLPSLFTSTTALVSPPVLVSPRSYDEYVKVTQDASRKNSEIIYSSSPVLKWSTPDVVGKLPESLSFVYDVSIVMPTEDYEVNSTDMKRALEELEPVYAKTGINGTSLELPAALFQELDLSAGYIMSVTARLQGNEADMTSVTILRNGVSDPAFITFLDAEKPTTYSVPRFITPKPVSEMTTHIGARVSWKKPLISWTAPEMSGAKADEVSFSYKIKIVEPTEDYEPNLEGTMKAVEKLKPFYEKSGITETEFQLPSEFMEKADSNMLYVMRVYAIPDTSSTGKAYTYESQGQSVPAIVYFREGDDDEGTGSMAYRDTVNNFINPEIVTPSFTGNEGARKRYINTDLSVKWEKPEYYGGHGDVRADSVRFTYDLELFRAKDYMEREEMLAQEPIIARRGLEVLLDTIRWSELEGKVEKNDYLLLRVMPRAVNDTAAVFLNDSINVVDFAMTEPFSKRYFQCANQVELDNMRPTTMKADDLQGKTVTVGEYDLVLDGTLSDLSSPGAIKGTGHVIWSPILDITWELCVKFDSIVINTDNQVIAGMVLTDKAPGSKMTSSGVVDSLFTDWGIDNLIGDTGIPYADHLQNELTGQAKGLAEKINLASYYEQVTEGYARMENLLDGGTIKDVGFPLEIPEEYNPSPVNIQINTMKFAPTYASMDLIGTFVVPETEATKDQILVFGAPRMCISPKSLIPEGATIALLKDFTVNDPKSDFTMTFKAPVDVVEPVNGCYLVWSENKFAELTAEIDMAMPNLKKVDDLGNVTEEQPILNVLATIRSWDDWIGSATLDAFEHESLPGFTFDKCQVVIDHSANQNHASCTRSTFPDKYDWEEAQVDPEAIEDWQGVYISRVGASLPNSITIGNGDRMSMFIENMIIDKSGCSLTAGVSNLVNYSAGDEGSIGGFAFSLDSIYVNVLQDDFNNFGFNGKLNIPLFTGKVLYDCKIQPLSKAEGDDNKKGYCYVFRTHQIEDLNFDFMLGNVKLEKALTYFLVEAYDKYTGDVSNGTETNVELCLGGTVDIVGQEKINDALKKLPFDLHMPGIKFCKLRLANNEKFESKYDELKLQNARLEAEKDMLADSKIHWWNTDTTYVFGEKDKVYLSWGRWGYASPDKKIGPFTFTLTDYGLKFEKGAEKSAILTVIFGGDITLDAGLGITGGTTIELQSELTNIDDISNIGIAFKGVNFNKISVGVKTNQLTIKGDLFIVDTETRSGYDGKLDVSLVDLFDLKGEGGFYEEQRSGGEGSYHWGYFVLSSQKIKMTPVEMYDVVGGFYVNARRKNSESDSDYSAEPLEGCNGIVMGLGIKMGDGSTFDGKFGATVLINKGKLATFKFTGKVNCASILDTKVTFVYENTPADKYFMFDCTVDFSADCGAGAVLDGIKDVTSKLQELNSKFEGYAETVTAGVESVMGDKSTSKASDSSELKDVKGGENSGGGFMKFHIEVSLKVTFRRDGKNLKSPDWYVWIGHPDKDKRCRFTFVDFRSKIVTVDIGADAYVCFGSELPNGGQLPPLPDDVAEFLDGGSHGAAQSDDIGTALKAQNKIKKKFDAMSLELGGGVMLGASAWGKIKFDLGLLYGKLGAEAGVDVVVAKLSPDAACTNLDDGPGFVGIDGARWYARGQIYAYLYAKFGFHIYLGFWNGDVDLVDCGIGGVLKCALPTPNYFEGKARVKIRLLGGLFKVDKKFTFECGDYCQLFLGNALDNFELFETPSVGTLDGKAFVDACSNQAKGKVNAGADESEGNPYEYDASLISTPYITTNAEINRDISIVDPTSADYVENTSNIEDEEGLKSRSSRKFKFYVPSHKAKVYRFSSYENMGKTVQVNDSVQEFQVNYNNSNYTYEYAVEYVGQKVLLKGFKPVAGYYYCVEMTGWSKEFRDGNYHDPETWDPDEKRYVEKPWSQTRQFFFKTADPLPDSYYEELETLQPLVKLAFPALYTTEGPQLVVEDKPNVGVACVRNDMLTPVISLNGQYRDRMFKKGRLQWEIVKVSSKERVDSVPNLWVENDSVSILTPERAFELPTFSARYNILLKHIWEDEIPSTDWTQVLSVTRQFASKAAAHNYAVTWICENNGLDVKLLRKSSITSELQVPSGFQIEVTEAGETESSGITMMSAELATGSSTTLIRANSMSLASTNTLSNSTSLSSSVSSGLSLSSLSTQQSTLSKYTIKVMQLKDGVRVNRHETVLYSQWTGSNGSNQTNYYGTMFTGQMLTELNRPETNPRVGDLEIVGYAKRKPYETTINSINQNFITSSPERYLSFLSNYLFVGGYEVDISRFDLYLTTSESMFIETPMGTYQGRLLGEQYGWQKYNYTICDGAEEIEKLLYPKYDYFAQRGIYYPIYCETTDSMAVYLYGEEQPNTMNCGVHEFMRMDPSSFYSYMTGLNRVLSTINGMLATNLKNFDSRSAQQNCAFLNAAAGYNRFYLGSDNLVQFYYPTDQFGVIGSSSPNGKKDIHKCVKVDVEKFRNNRIESGDYPPYVYSLAMSGDKFLPYDSKANLKNIKSWTFKYYRCNAWNFRRKCWTVFNDENTPAGKNNARFCGENVKEDPFK